MMKKKVGICMFFVLLLALFNVYAEGLLPSLTETVGIPMPSFGETANRFPEEESEKEGTSIERYTDVSEEEFNSFNIHLEEIGASIQDYSVNSNVLTATILYNESSMSIQFDSKKAEIVISYPPHTFDGWIEKYKRDYAEGVEKLNNQDWDDAVEAFKNAGAYSDAQQMISQTYYLEGISKLESKDWAGAIEAFKNAGDYSDAKTKIKETYYAEGTVRKHAKEWDLAIAAFTNAGDYADSNELKLECSYQKALQLTEDEKYDEALQLFSSFSSYKDSATRIKELSYNKAMLAFNNSSYGAARELFVMSEDYKDARNMEREARIRTIGTIIQFGHYEQDNITSNGSEPIEWLVIASDRNKVLLLTKYGIDSQIYDSRSKNVNWETSSLRKWLNKEFLNRAFSKKEQKVIILSNISNSKNEGNPDWKNSANGGNDTKDRIFLLSYNEAYNKYFNSDSDRQMIATNYAKEYGVETYKENPFSGWWLRSPGYESNKMSIVTSDGTVSATNYSQHQRSRGYYSYVAVRPALWIDLTSLDLTTFEGLK